MSNMWRMSSPQVNQRLEIANYTGWYMAYVSKTTLTYDNKF